MKYASTSHSRDHLKNGPTTGVLKQKQSLTRQSSIRWAHSVKVQTHLGDPEELESKTESVSKHA